MPVKRELLFVQGGGKGAHDEWDSKLVESLRRELGQDYEILYPRMPNEEDPSYATWKITLEKMFGTLHDGAILVGHSVGGTTLVKALTEQSSTRKFGAIFLIAAPFVGDGGWSSEDLQFPPDLGARLPEGIPISFYHGLEDKVAPPSHVELYARAVPQARFYRLPGRDHQLNNDLGEVAAAIRSTRRGPDPQAEIPIGTLVAGLAVFGLLVAAAWIGSLVLGFAVFAYMAGDNGSTSRPAAVSDRITSGLFTVAIVYLVVFVVHLAMGKGERGMLMGILAGVASCLLFWLVSWLS